MESYQDFYSRNLARLQTERKTTVRHAVCGQQGRLSTIRFHGRPVLFPVLSDEQRKEMVQYRHKATQLDTGRQGLQRGRLLAWVQNEEDQELPGQRETPVSATLASCSENGFCRAPGMTAPVRCAAALGEGPGEVEEQGVDDKGGSRPNVSLQVLLRRSREYLEQEQGRRGSRCTPKATPSLRESHSDKENQRGSRSSGEEPSPSTPSPASTYHQTGSPEALSGSFLHSLPRTCMQIPGTDPGLSPRPHRRRPRPISTGSILATSPINLLDDGFTQGDSLASSLDGSQNGSLFVPGPSCSLSPLGSGIATSGFRRRCHTLDSHLNPPIDRNRERFPRLMVPRSPPYDIGSPSLRRPRSHIAHDSLSRAEAGSPQSSWSSAENWESKTGGRQLKVQALEEMRQRLEEEHNWQLSVLIAEQERAQQRLLQCAQELEEKEKLTELGNELTTPGDPATGLGIQMDHVSPLSPSCFTLFPAARSPGGSRGSLPSLSPGVPSPNIHPPVYLWGGSKTWDRLIQMLSPEMQKALCRLSAVARGFLTRRLLKTEKLKHLRQTVQDTRDFIQSFQTEAPLKKGVLSAQDMALQERVRAQLRAALYDVHDIFFEMPLGNRLALLQQDRELRTERKIREMEKASSPKDKVTLSAATQKSLDRKKLRVGETPGHTKRAHQKPKSPPTNRILQPSQGQNAQIPSQLLRQGSLYRKTPQERVKHLDLRKRHSLG